MSRTQRGFTLIELMIVIAIIAIIAAIAIPNLLAARLAANETAAVATLRNIVSSQAQFQQGAKADEDSDGAGEYGGFLDMAGFAAPRLAAGLVPPVLSTAFQNLNGNGEVTRSGYVYRMYLPAVAADGTAVGEPTTGFALLSLDPDLCETTWCAYAWPANYQQSGNHTYFVNQAGDVLSTEDSAGSYDGPGAGPSPYAAFVGATDITSQVAIDDGSTTSAATDGNFWRPVG